MFAFLLWCILFVLCWPLALLALVLVPVRLARAAPLPSGGNCGARRVGPRLGCGHASRASVERAFPALSHGGGSPRFIPTPRCARIVADRLSLTSEGLLV